MIIQASNPQSYAEMVQAHKARQARYAAAARNVQVRALPAPTIDVAFRPYVTRRLPLWQVGDVQFDDHVWAYVRWRLQRTANIRNYIRQRCAELCVSYTEITAGGQSRALVPPRDRIVYEIKTMVDPTISLGALGRHFSRDHSSMIVSFYRGAALAGDQEMAAKISIKRQRAKDRYQTSKARGE